MKRAERDRAPQLQNDDGTAVQGQEKNAGDWLEEMAAENNKLFLSRSRYGKGGAG